MGCGCASRRRAPHGRELARVGHARCARLESLDLRIARRQCLAPWDGGRRSDGADESKDSEGTPGGLVREVDGGRSRARPGGARFRGRHRERLTAFSEGTYWREVLLYVRTRPFAPVVGHSAYFGALAVLACVVWPRALAAAGRLGPGPFVALALMGLQALDAESRRLTANWPLVGLCVVIAIEPWLRDRRVMAAALFACLLFSKLWWRWSGPNLFAEAHDPGNYYNLQGPSLSHEAYAVHLIATALLATVAWLFVRRRPSPSREHVSSIVTS